MFKDEGSMLNSSMYKSVSWRRLLYYARYWITSCLRGEQFLFLSTNQSHHLHRTLSWSPYRLCPTNLYCNLSIFTLYWKGIFQSKIEKNKYNYLEVYLSINASKFLKQNVYNNKTIKMHLKYHEKGSGLLCYSINILSL